MIDHKNRRVLLSFLIILVLTFEPCCRQVTSDSSEGAIVMLVIAIVFITIIKSITLFYCFSLVVLVSGRSQVITLRDL
jgi:hypothetical protein